MQCLYNSFTDIELNVVWNKACITYTKHRYIYIWLYTITYISSYSEIKKVILKRFVSDELLVLYGREKEKKNITQITRKERLLITQSLKTRKYWTKGNCK